MSTDRACGCSGLPCRCYVSPERQAAFEAEMKAAAPLVYRVEWTLGEWGPAGMTGDTWKRTWEGDFLAAYVMRGPTEDAWIWKAWTPGEEPRGETGRAPTIEAAKAAADTWLRERCAR